MNILILKALCYDPAMIADVLAKQYHEEVVAEAQTDLGPSRLFTSDAGTWSLAIQSDGLLCIVAHGTDWAGVPNL